MCDKCKKQWLNLYKGFICNQCNSFDNTVLRINKKQEQLEFYCMECKRKWI